jgi:hypothetical protein
MTTSKPRSRIRAWATLSLCLLMIWGFGAFVGPWFVERIPIMKEIVNIIEEQDINASAYFYTEIEASYEGERYLRESLAREAPEQSGLTWPLISAIGICIALLALGFRYLPND